MKSNMFETWKEQARRLPIEELKRHASVSANNRHKCQECFCCAALEVMREGTTVPGGHSSRRTGDV